MSETDLSSKVQVECCVCKRWEKEGTRIFFNPTPEQRREYHFKGGKLTHGYCPVCYIEDLKSNGFIRDDLQSIIDELYGKGNIQNK